MSGEPASLSAFADKACPPTDDAVAAALGPAAEAWARLVSHLGGARGVKASLHFMYGKKYGWAMRFQRAGRAVAALYPNVGRVTLQVIISAEQAAALRALHPAGDVLAALDSAREYPEGAWVYLPVRSVEQADRAIALLDVKLGVGCAP